MRTFRWFVGADVNGKTLENKSFKQKGCSIIDLFFFIFLVLRKDKMKSRA